MHKDMTLLGYLALQAPKPSSGYIEFQMKMDINNNPYNDYNKPKRRSENEITIEYQFQWAQDFAKKMNSFK